MHVTATRSPTFLDAILHEAMKLSSSISVSSDGDEILERWPLQWFHLVVDGSEVLLGAFDADGRTLHQGVWTNSPYLAVASTRPSVRRS